MVLSPAVAPPPRDETLPRTTLEDARTLFAADPGFLDTASCGLPATPTVVALEEGLAAWRSGRATAQGYDAAVAAARAGFARLVGANVDDVAVGSQASVFVGLIAAALPAGAEVVVPEGEFTSVVFPFLAHEPRGMRVRQVPLEALAEAIDE